MKINELENISENIVDEMRREIGLEDDEIAIALLSAFHKLDKEELPDFLTKQMG